MRRWNNLPIHPAKVVLAINPKCANTSVKRVVQSVIGGEGPLHAVMERWSPAEVAASGYRVIALVRHPAARAVSCWWQKLSGPGVGRSSLMKTGLYRRGMTFAEFMRVAAADPDETCDIHIQSQVVGMVHEGRFLPDMVLRIEDPWSWARVQAEVPIGLPDLGHENESNPPSWQGLVHGDVDERVRARWARDYEAFGYA